MPTLTPCLSFPIPVGTDAPDVAGDFARLANAIDTYLCNLNTKSVGELFHFYDTGRGYPDGALLCDGSTFNPATYPQLNTHLGGNQLPDLRGRFLMMASTAYPLLSQGGFTDQQVPEHTHAGPNHSHGMSHTHGASAGTVSADHVHSVPGHQHYMNHTHDLQNHQHLETARAGYTMHIAGRSGHTNAIFTDNGVALDFIERASAVMQSQVPGPATDWSGTPNINNTGWASIGDWTSPNSAFNTGGISTNHTHGITVGASSIGTTADAGTNQTGGAVSASGVAASGAGRNLPPYRAVAILIQAK